MPQRLVPDPSCRGCGRQRAKLADGYCLDCLAGAHSDRAGAEALLAYVRDHPRVTVGEAARAVGIRPSRIRELIDSGRLQTT